MAKCPQWRSVGRALIQNCPQLRTTVPEIGFEQLWPTELDIKLQTFLCPFILWTTSNEPIFFLIIKHNSLFSRNRFLLYNLRWWKQMVLSPSTSWFSLRRNALRTLGRNRSVKGLLLYRGVQRSWGLRDRRTVYSSRTQWVRFSWVLERVRRFSKLRLFSSGE